MHEVNDILGNKSVNGDSEQNETDAHGHEFVYLDCFPGRKFHTNCKKSSSFASKLGSAPLTVSNLKYVLIIFKNTCHKKIDKMNLNAFRGFI